MWLGKTFSVALIDVVYIDGIGRKLKLVTFIISGLGLGPIVDVVIQIDAR